MSTLTDKEFDESIKLFEKAAAAASRLSSYQLWAEDAEALAEQLGLLVARMKER